MLKKLELKLADHIFFVINNKKTSSDTIIFTIQKLTNFVTGLWQSNH